VSRENTRHVLFPYAVEAAAVVGWLVAFLGTALVPLPVPGWLFFPAAATLIAAVLAWGFPDPDYGAAGGHVVAATGGGKVVPRVAMVAMLLGTLLGLVTMEFAYAVAFGAAGIVCSVVGGLLGRRVRA
jgi:hypothetical protein